MSSGSFACDVTPDTGPARTGTGPRGLCITFGVTLLLGEADIATKDVCAAPGDTGDLGDGVASELEDLKENNKKI